MRLQEYINYERSEIIVEHDYNEMVDLIKMNCKYFLKISKKEPLYRGIERQNIEDNNMAIKYVRPDRRSRGMPDKVFVLFNKWLDEHNHTRRDQSISTGSDYKRYSMFGTVYVIFPLGKFDYTWTTTKDINYETYTDYSYFELEKMLIEGDKELSLKYDKLMYTNKKIERAIKYGYEIWMNPKKYYLMTIDTYEKVKKLL